MHASTLNDAKSFLHGYEKVISELAVPSISENSGFAGHDNQPAHDLHLFRLTDFILSSFFFVYSLRGYTSVHRKRETQYASWSFLHLLFIFSFTFVHTNITLTALLK